MLHFTVFQYQNEAVRSGNYPDHLRLRCFWLYKVSLSEAEFATFPREYPAYKVFFFSPLKHSSVFLHENLFAFFLLEESSLLFTLGLSLSFSPRWVERGKWVCMCGSPPPSFHSGIWLPTGNISFDFLLAMWQMWRLHPWPFKGILPFISLLQLIL